MYVLETGQACLVLPDLSKHSYSGHTLCDRRHICPLSPGPGRWSSSLLPHASPPTQAAGDIFFLPRLWGHGTVNLGEAVGVATPFSVRPADEWPVARAHIPAS